MLRGKRTAACAAVAVVGALATLSAQAASGSTGKATSSERGSGAGSGRLVYVAQSDDYGKVSVTTLGLSAADGSHRQVVYRSLPDYFGLPSLSGDGRELVYFSADKQNAGVRIRDLATRKVTDLFSSSSRRVGIFGIAISSDDSEVAYGCNLSATGQIEKKFGLWIVPAAGGTPREIVDNVEAVSPTRLPDNRFLYLVPGAKPTSSTAVWEVDADGSDDHRLFSKPFGIEDESVSPNGRWLAFDRPVNATTSYIQKIRLDGSHLTTLTPRIQGRDDDEPTWSPSGRSLAFLSSRAGRYEAKRSQPLFDGYEMSATGKNLHAVIRFTGSKAGLDRLSWGG